MPRSMQQLIALIMASVEDLTAALEAGQMTVAQWRQDMERELAKAHTAAMMIGSGSSTLSNQAQKYIKRIVSTQIDFLKNFALEIQSEREWKKGWNARALMYASATGASYWGGYTKFLPLPAMPRDGTSQCLSRCTCSWRIIALNEEQGDYDCYWVLGASERHCQTCPIRAADWAPLRIRGGELL